MQPRSFSPASLLPQVAPDESQAASAGTGGVVRPIRDFVPLLVERR
jgi:hypothetical protein